MSVKETVFNMFEAMNNRNFEVLPQYLAPSYTNHSMPMPMNGPEGMKAVLSMFFAAFPDMHVTVQDVAVEGNVAFGRGYWTGTHRGDFNGIPATGKQVKVEFIDCWHFANGKATDNWVQMDNLGMMVQLGVIPAPAH
jgi:steroid delta-isomerase-like uncharacterized protein